MTENHKNSPDTAPASAPDKILGESFRRVARQIQFTTAGVAERVGGVIGGLLIKYIPSLEQQGPLLRTLRNRFEANKNLFQKLRGDITWSEVESALRANPKKLWAIQWMEETGGEPDVIGEENGEFIFGDCSEETPAGRSKARTKGSKDTVQEEQPEERRNLVYDEAAQEDMKDFYTEIQCHGNVIFTAGTHKVEVMDETMYRALQAVKPIDKKTRSWLKTPPEIRKNGNALVGCRIIEKDKGFVNVYPIAATTHIMSDIRGFRAVLRVPRV